MSAPVRIPLALIYPSDHGRAVQAKAVANLVESMAAIGLRTPITVRPVVKVADGRDTNAYEIVTGRHRYQAAIDLKWQEIECFVMGDDEIDAQLWEIDENLMRAELSPAQIAEHVARRKRLWEAKVGQVVPVSGGRGNKAFAAETAEKTGQSKRDVNRAVSRGEKIAPDVLKAVQGTDLDKGTVLDELAKTPIEEQAEKVRELARRKEQRRQIVTAQDFINKHDGASVAADIILSVLVDDDFDRLIAALAGTTTKDLIRALKRGSEDRRAA